MHAIYGFGATISPLVSTEFVKQLPGTVYYYFAVSLGLALFTSLALVLVFRLRTEDQVVGRRGPDEVAAEDVVVGPTGESEGEKRDREMLQRREAGSSGNKMSRIMKTPAVHFMSFYIMIYVGVEVTIGGWAVSLMPELPQNGCADGRLRSFSMREEVIRVLDTSRQAILAVLPLAESFSSQSPTG